MLSSSAFNAYQHATGAQLDDKTGFLRVSQEQYDSMGSLRMCVGEDKFEITRDAQRWPKALNAVIGGDGDGVYLVVSDVSFPLSLCNYSGDVAHFVHPTS
jgi:hypothetical protein